MCVLLVHTLNLKKQQKNEEQHKDVPASLFKAFEVKIVFRVPHDLKVDSFLHSENFPEEKIAK